MENTLFTSHMKKKSIKGYLYTQKSVKIMTFHVRREWGAFHKLIPTWMSPSRVQRKTNGSNFLARSGSIFFFRAWLESDVQFKVKYNLISFLNYVYLYFITELLCYSYWSGNYFMKLFVGVFHRQFCSQPIRCIMHTFQ